MAANKENLAEECRLIFLKELEQNFYWRVFRLSTFKDLIVSKIAKYNNTSAFSDKVELINTCCKGLIIQKLGEMDISNFSSEEIQNQILRENPEIISHYNYAIETAITSDLNAPFLLSDEKSYLKILSLIDSRNFPEQNIQHILSNLLRR